MIKSKARIVVALPLAGHAGLVHASGSPIGDGIVYILAWLALCAVLLLVSILLAVRRGRVRGARSGWLYLAGAALALPLSLPITTFLFSTGWIPSPAAPWLTASCALLPTLALWGAFLAAVRIDDGRDQNRVWKTTR